MFLPARVVAASLLAAALLLSVLANAASAGQAASPSALRLAISDAQAAPIPGATCSLVGGMTASTQTVVSDERGVCTFPVIRPGAYTVRVELDGFDPFVRQDLALGGAGAVELPVVLAVARLTQSVTVTAKPASDTSVAAGSVPAVGNIEHSVLRTLPLASAAVDAALPLVPGVLRSTTGELTFNGASERQSALLVNGMNAADPATGNFRLSIPIDSVEAVQVFLHPYTAEYGEFTGGITRVYTRAGGNRWHFELNDFLPDLRFVHGRVHGIAEDSPHLNVSGPVFGGRVHLSQSAAYTLENRPVRGLEFPNNETHNQGVSAFTQLDFSIWRGHEQRATFGYAPGREDYVGLDVFRPRPVTPSRTQRDAWVTVRDNSQILKGFLTSAVSFRSFDVDVFGQGNAELMLTPTGEVGNYFARQDRASSRLEAFESYALPTLHWVGTHDVKFGVDVNDSISNLDINASPVNVVRANGTLARRITFAAVPTIHAANREAVGFLQDRWTVRPDLSVDFGLRFEDQRIADPHIVVPRVGFAWSPFGESTAVRGGVGLFYDKVPLNIRSFAQFPARTSVRYAPDGQTILDSRVYYDVLADAEQPRVWNHKNVDDETAFVPQNLTWNLQVDHTFSPRLAVRANVVSSDTSSIYIVQPRAHASGTGALLLSSTGRSRYRAAEFTGRVGRVSRSLNVSYTRSNARGDLNDFNAFFGDFAAPIVRANQYSQMPEDAPHRIIAWGAFELPKRVTLAPVFEARSGFPYSVRDEDQNFVGRRNADSRRFPWFVALDLEAAKEVRVTGRYGIRLSVRGFNLTNHFNPRDVRANLGDPRFGQFLASYRRYFAAGFDLVF